MVGLGLEGVTKVVKSEITPMGKLFAVARFRGPQWDHARSLEQQENWRTHADFMNALEAEHFIVLGGRVNHVAISASTPAQDLSRFGNLIGRHFGGNHIQF